MKKLITCFVIILTSSIPLSVFAEKIDLEGFTQLSTEEFRSLAVNKTITGIWKGNRYAEKYFDTGEIKGGFPGSPYTGRWIPSDTNNCIWLQYAGISRTCWIILVKDGVYVYARHNKKAKKPREAHYIELLMTFSLKTEPI